MKSLKELVDLLSRNKLKRINLLDLKEKPDSKINRLYQAIAKDEVESDKDAQQLIYGHLNQAQAYSNLKKTLRERLINSLFFVGVDKRKADKRQRAFIEVEKSLAAAQLLLAKSAQFSAERLFTSCLKDALKYEFVEAVLSSSRALRLIYGTRRGEVKKYDYYSNLYSQYREIDYWENKAESYYTEITSRYLTGKEKPEELSELAKNHYVELAAAMGSVETYKFRFFLALIQFMQFTVKNNYSAVIPLSESVIQFFRAKPYLARTPIQQCLHHQLVAYMQLKDYRRGYEVAKLGEELLGAGEKNWFNNREYLLILALHTGHYQDAYEHYREAVGHRRFAFQTENYKRDWGIYRAYLHFLIRRDLIKAKHKDRDFSTQKYNKLIAEPETEVTERRRTNVPLLIIQALGALEQGKERWASGKIESLEKYGYRNLYEQGGMRPFYFIRLLSLLNRVEFNGKEAEKQADGYLEKLRELSGTNSTPFHKMEIVPFELLWEMALQLAEKVQNS